MTSFVLEPLAFVPSIRVLHAPDDALSPHSPCLASYKEGVKKENGARLVGGSRESVGLVASRRAVTPKGEADVVSLLPVVAAAPEDEVVEVMRLAEGEAMLVSAR